MSYDVFLGRLVLQIMTWPFSGTLLFGMGKCSYRFGPKSHVDLVLSRWSLATYQRWLVISQRASVWHSFILFCNCFANWPVLLLLLLPNYFTALYTQQISKTGCCFWPFLCECICTQTERLLMRYWCDMVEMFGMMPSEVIRLCWHFTLTFELESYFRTFILWLHVK